MYGYGYYITYNFERRTCETILIENVNHDFYKIFNERKINMQQINVNVLKPHPRNNEFFDDLSGEEFERLKESIKTQKIYTDILVSPDMTIISGHQRVRAAKELGMKLVPIKIDQDLQNEESKLLALIANNFGRRKNDPAKDRKAIETYVTLNGFTHGGDRKSKDQSDTLKLSDIAKELNTSETTLKRLLRIERNLTESMKELLDSGEITKTLAADTIASLSPAEQEELIAKLDVTKKITKQQVQQYIDEIRQLKENNIPEVQIIDNTDYRIVDDCRKKIAELEERLQLSKHSNDTLEAINNLISEENERLNKIQNEIRRVTQQKNDISMQILAIEDIVKFSYEVQNLLETKLAPLKFMTSMDKIGMNQNIHSTVTDLVNKVNSWVKEIQNYINCKENIIVEVENY